MAVVRDLTPQFLAGFGDRVERILDQTAIKGVRHMKAAMREPKTGTPAPTAGTTPIYTSGHSVSDGRCGWRRVRRAPCMRCERERVRASSVRPENIMTNDEIWAWVLFLIMAVVAVVVALPKGW